MAGVESDQAQRVTRRRLLMTAGGVAAAGSVAYVAGRGVTYSGSQVAPRSAGGGPAGLNAFAANVVPGGPGRDGIPAIDRPRFIVPRPGLLADEAVSGRVELPQQTLAAMLGAQRPSLNKVLKDLERDGLITISYGAIEIRDTTRLASRA